MDTVFVARLGGDTKYDYIAIGSTRERALDALWRTYRRGGGFYRGRRVWEQEYWSDHQSALDAVLELPVNGLGEVL